MCFFLTIAVPAKHVDQIGAVFGRGFQSRLSVNPSVESALPTGFAARIVTRGTCSCDLYGPAHQAPSVDSADHLRRKYERRGWSNAKIARAIEQASNSRRPGSGASGLRVDVVERLTSLCRNVGSVAVFVHWYHGDPQAERVTLRTEQQCPCEELPAQAMHLSQDHVLLAITRQTS